MGCCLSRAVDMLLSWDHSMDQLKVDLEKSAKSDRQMHLQMRDMQTRLTNLEKGTVLAF